MDCGPTCLAMICRYYGFNPPMDEIRELTEAGKTGINFIGLSDAAQQLGFDTEAVQLNANELQDIKLPCILYWQQNHFTVLYKVKGNKYYLADPANSLMTMNESEFKKYWLNNSNGTGEGIALTLTYSSSGAREHNYPSAGEDGKRRRRTALQYLYPHRRQLIQLIAGLLLGSLIQLIFPFLTQSIIDIGINTADLSFIHLILFAQLALFAGRLAIDFTKSRILYHISTRINLNILTDFMLKLMKLPVSFFDRKRTGDIMQRMNDHTRIENFLTGTSLSAVFSLFNLVIFSIVLAYYSMIIFAVFSVATVLYLMWISLFLSRRKSLDYERFNIEAAERGKVLEIVHGMQEIKLYGAEFQKRSQWEKLLALSYRLGIKNLSLDQLQQSGGVFINEVKNIIISFLAATAVIRGDLTLGGMLAIQFVAGQLSNPVEQMISFVQNWQLAGLSLDRLNEIQSAKNEEETGEHLSKTLPADQTLRIENLSFRYTGAGNENVLHGISMTIPAGKTTAIVGASGSGKTTLIKLLLKFYETGPGKIFAGNTDLHGISHKAWRKQISSVMQDSFIFNDDITANIAVGENEIDLSKLRSAARTANILEFIDSLPLGFETKIGADGTGLSAGQKQRLLIARAVYKNPVYLFFDEATNNLDAENELIVMNNMTDFLKGRTAIIVAHRLSTVKNADHIIVLVKGEIKEQGTHDELIRLKGSYYQLIKNQLELGE